MASMQTLAPSSATVTLSLPLHATITALQLVEVQCSYLAWALIFQNKGALGSSADLSRVSHLSVTLPQKLKTYISPWSLRAKSFCDPLTMVSCPARNLWPWGIFSILYILLMVRASSVSTTLMWPARVKMYRGWSKISYICSKQSVCSMILDENTFPTALIKSRMEAGVEIFCCTFQHNNL